MHQTESRSLERRLLLHGFLLSSAFAILLLITTPYFNVLDDEADAISAAHAPIASILKPFMIGSGQGEHPPLSDLLLHLWLPVAGVNLHLIRLPFILFYAAGIFVLALVAKKLSGTAAFYSTFLVCILWPYGFHFGRLAGWYSFCFFLVALLTFTYFYFLEAPDWRRWSLVIAIAFVLVASNYFGWELLFLIAIDLCFSMPFSRAVRFIAVGAITLSIAYAPLWTSFSVELFHHDTGMNDALNSRILNTAFNGYSFFVSESVAPWYWKASAFACCAITAVLFLAIFLCKGTARRMYFGFLLLFASMAATNILNTKRLLFIGCWFLVAIGCALADRSHRKLRFIFTVSLAVIAGVGWFGIFARNYYSSAHFIEPWPAVADSAASQVIHGNTVVTNSDTFLFYLNGALNKDGFSRNDRAGFPDIPQVISIVGQPLPAEGFSGRIVFIRGTNVFAREQTSEAENWLVAHCTADASTPLYAEPGYELKQRYFPNGIDGRYRILAEQFLCK